MSFLFFKGYFNIFQKKNINTDKINTHIIFNMSINFERTGLSSYVRKKNNTLFE